jgi:hypothetical protein
MHMVRQYDPGTDMERPRRQFRSHGIPCTNGAFKVLALGIVLAQRLADQREPLQAGQACGVLALACWSTPYVC